MELLEALVLRTTDLIVNGPEKQIIVGGKDSFDARPIVITESLAHVLYEYVVYSRRTYSDAKRSPYVFLVDGGSPLEKEAVLGMAADIGRVIGIPDFSVEMLSLAWEERLSAGMDETAFRRQRGLR
ncbi:hypothetical protein AB7714_05825 [Tardiphaga sp. 1201_B9_N1_1]|uniref:hypothetical protein n=1 Tax=unclassified Tardiphaga TaxID=2631404 RepID=UPI003F24CF6D